MHETQAGIYDHVANERLLDSEETRSAHDPLAIIRMHPEQNLKECDRFYDSADRYADSGIYEVFGLSLIQFLSLDTYICEYLYEIAAKHTRRNNADVNKQTKELMDTINSKK